MSISVVDPISPAIERTRLVLFQPFDLGKWFILGFVPFWQHWEEAAAPTPSATSATSAEALMDRDWRDWLRLAVVAAMLAGLAYVVIRAQERFDATEAAVQAGEGER